MKSQTTSMALCTLAFAVLVSCASNKNDRTLASNPEATKNEKNYFKLNQLILKMKNMTVSTNIRLDVGSVRDYTDFNGFTKPSENCEFISHEVNQDKVDSVRTGISYKVKNAEVELVYQHSMDLAKIFKYPQEVLTSNLMDPLLVHVQTKFYLVAINNESSVKNITMICQSEPYGVFGWQRSDLNGQLEKLVFKYLEKYKE